MIYSKTSQYAIRALCYLTTKNGGFATISEVGKATGIPPSYVAKVFQCLVRSGILKSQSGPGGGFSLGVDASKLTLLRIVQAVDEPSESPLKNCVMGQAECNDKNPCSLHPIWKKAREAMCRRLAMDSILDVARMKDRACWNKKKRVLLSKRMQSVFGY